MNFSINMLCLGLLFNQYWRGQEIIRAKLTGVNFQRCQSLPCRIALSIFVVGILPASVRVRCSLVPPLPCHRAVLRGKAERGRKLRTRWRPRKQQPARGRGKSKRGRAMPAKLGRGCWAATLPLRLHNDFEAKLGRFI